MDTFKQPKLPGYHQLSEADAALMTEIKLKGIELGELIERLQATPGLDQRWVDLGKTDLQKGIMFILRAVAQPTTF